MKLYNMTGHSVNLINKDGELVKVIEAQPEVLRVDTLQYSVGYYSFLPIYSYKEFLTTPVEEVEEFAKNLDGIIVSHITAVQLEKAGYNLPVYTIGKKVTNKFGVTGCENLVRYI